MFVYSEAGELEKKAFQPVRRKSWPKCAGQAKQTASAGQSAGDGRADPGGEGDWKGSCRQMNDPVF